MHFAHCLAVDFRPVYRKYRAREPNRLQISGRVLLVAAADGWMKLLILLYICERIMAWLWCGAVKGADRLRLPLQWTCRAGVDQTHFALGRRRTAGARLISATAEARQLPVAGSFPRD
jgi:hypothetical protein